MLTKLETTSFNTPFSSPDGLSVECPDCHVVLDDGGTKTPGVRYKRCPDCQEKENHSVGILPPPESLKNK